MDFKKLPKLFLDGRVYYYMPLNNRKNWLAFKNITKDGFEGLKEKDITPEHLFLILATIFEDEKMMFNVGMDKVEWCMVALKINFSIIEKTECTPFCRQIANGLGEKATLHNKNCTNSPESLKEKLLLLGNYFRSQI